MGSRKFSLYDIEQFMREAGAERITEDAIMDLEREMERLAEKITNKALRYAEHAGRRKLIKRSDVALTRKQTAPQANFQYGRTDYMSPATLRRSARITNPASIADR